MVVQGGTHLVAMMRWFENKKHCLTASFSLLKLARRDRLERLSLGSWIRVPVDSARPGVLRTLHRQPGPRLVHS